jgi:Ribbon-helix-helix protein, copG family.
MSDSKIKQILLRVSEEEKKQIEQMAKDNKMSVTAFIKNRVLSNDISESYTSDILEKEQFFLEKIEELKKDKEEDKKHYREWIEGMNRTLQLLNDEKENLLERNNKLLIELDEQKNKTFLQRLKGLFG